MGYAATAERLAQNKRVLELTAEHERFCERRSQRCLTSAALAGKIPAMELRDVEVATAINEVDEVLARIRGRRATVPASASHGDCG